MKLITIKCDCCGKTVTEKTKTEFAVTITKTVNKNSDYIFGEYNITNLSADEETFDLCPSCAKNITEKFNILKKEMLRFRNENGGK